MQEIFSCFSVSKPEDAFWLGLIGGAVILIFIFAVWRFISTLDHGNNNYAGHFHSQSVSEELVEVEKQTEWTCPRCSQIIGKDPDDEDTDFCPKCNGSLWNMTCPQCGKDIWSDLEVCPECQAQLTMSKCPECGRRIFISKYHNCCPYCEEDLWICPRCGQYVRKDPAEEEKCPECGQPWQTYDCPECGYEHIFLDQKVCPGCQKTLQYESCPECGTSIPSGLDECPSCEEELTVTDCPHCDKKHYIED